MIAPTPKVDRKQKKRAPTTFVWGMILLCAGILLACYLIFMTGGDDKSDEGKSAKEEKRPQSSGQSKQSKIVKSETPQPPAELSNWDIRHLPASETNRLTQAEYSYWRMFNPIVPFDPPSPHPKPTAHYRIFKDRANNDIAFVISTEPGTRVLGNHEFGEAFTKRFLRSLETPIEIDPNDSPHDKELKQAVIEAREELRKAYIAGEDIGKIMNDSRAELQKLGAYKAEIEREVAKLSAKPGVSADDLEDLIDAANLMLEKKGVAPIKGTLLSKLAFKRMLEQQHN